MTLEELADPKHLLTNGQMLSLCRDCADEAQATKLLEALVRRGMAEDSGLTEEEARKRCRANIGYLAGYCGLETQLRWERLFGAVHPVFGAVDSVESPKTIEETLRLGMQLINRGIN